MAAPRALWPVLAGAAAVRVLLWASGWGQVAEQWIEVSTPVSSFETLVEGKYMRDFGLSAYSGDNVHQTLGWGEWTSWGLFGGADVVAGYLLCKAALLHYSTLAQPSDRMRTLAVIAAAFYVLNPFIVMSCVGRSSTTINNAAVILALYGAVRGNSAMSTFGLALATCLSMYSALLLVPVVLLHAKPSSPDKGWSMGAAAAVMGFYTLWGMGLVYMSRLFVHDWSFVDAVYTFAFAVPDLTPNIGLYWYYFLEIFDHFREFFLCVFNLSVLACATPLIIRLRSDPVLLFTLLVFVIGTLKSYPSVGDLAMSLALVPLWTHLMPYMRFLFVVANVIVFCTVLTPIMWHLWIYAGSGNANFFFALTIVINAASTFLAIDLLQAHARRKFDVTHGLLVPDPAADIAMR